jgi:hypothetical protein
MDWNESIRRACEGVPGLIRAALALLPEGLLIAGIGEEKSFDHEPLVRSAVACLSRRNTAPGGNRDPFVEYVFVCVDQVVVIQAGRREPRLALALVCTREANLAFVLDSTRRALTAMENSISLVALGVTP